MSSPRIELIRDGNRMGLWLGEMCLAVVEAGLPAQQLARYVEMQLRAGYKPEAIQAMLRGESQATTGSTAPVRKAKPTSKKASSKKAAPKKPAKKAAKKASKGKKSEDLAAVLAGTVSDVKKRLATGDFDGRVDALTELETGGKGRKGVLKALAARGDAA